MNFETHGSCTWLNLNTLGSWFWILNFKGPWQFVNNYCYFFAATLNKWIVCKQKWLNSAGANCNFDTKFLPFLLHLLGSGDIFPEHNGGYRSNEENLGRHKNKKRESKPKYLCNMENHLVMTVFRIQITRLQANLTAHVGLVTPLLTWVLFTSSGYKVLWNTRMALHTSHWSQGSFFQGKLEHMYSLNGTGMEAWNKGCSVTPSDWAPGQRDHLNRDCSSTSGVGGCHGEQVEKAAGMKQTPNWQFYCPGTKIFSVITEKYKYRKQSVSWQMKPCLAMWHVVSCTGRHSREQNWNQRGKVSWEWLQEPESHDSNSDYYLAAARVRPALPPRAAAQRGSRASQDRTAMQLFLTRPARD